jgi:hypothetical protein
MAMQMGDLEPYEIALLLLMHDRGIIDPSNYVSVQKVASKVNGQQVQSAYGIKDGLEKVARRLVKVKLLSDAGKSMDVLYVDKFGVLFVAGYLKTNPTAIADLEAKLNEK